MASDLVAYFKWVRLGDLLRGLPALAIVQQSSEPRVNIQGDVAVVTNRAAGVSRQIDATFHMLRGHFGAETHRAFQQRVIAFHNQWADAIGVQNGYVEYGDFVLVDDSSTDLTTLAAPATASPGQVSLTLTADVGFAPNDIAYLTDGAGKAETFLADAGTSGTTLVAPSLQNDWSAGDTVARGLWWFPASSCIVSPTIQGNEPSTYRAAMDMQASFVSVEKPVS